MKLELPFYHYARKFLEHNTYDAQIIDYMELLGTPENRTISYNERIEELYRILNEITRINENRLTMEQN